MRVSLKGICKSFGETDVVRGLDLEVEEGEFLVLLGPSGCGKTTALRILAGLEAADSGTIRIGSRDVTQVLPKYRDVAMVFQSYALYPHMTVAGNIGYPLRLRRIEEEKKAQRIAEVAEKVGLGALLERYPRQLSGGQRQRVALARAMVRTPSLFLMDEPLSNLDAKLRGQMRAELKRLQHDLGTTTIYVTHDQVEAMTLAHRVAVMNAGVLQQVGPPKEIYENPANLFVAGFVGSPPMNFIDGAIEDGMFRSSHGNLPMPGRPSRQGVVLGFRPEDARITREERESFAASVYSTEMPGNETIVTFRIGGTHVVIKAGKEFQAAPDTPVRIAPDPHMIRLFDQSDGKRLEA